MSLRNGRSKQACFQGENCRSGIAGSPTQRRRARPDHPGGQPGQQLGVHGHGQPGLEPEGVGRVAGARDVPARPGAPDPEANAVADGVQDVPCGNDRDSLPDRPQRPPSGVSLAVLESVAGCLPAAGGAAQWLLAVLSRAKLKPGSGCPGPCRPSKRPRGWSDERRNQGIGDRVRGPGPGTVRLYTILCASGTWVIYYACFRTRSVDMDSAESDIDATARCITGSIRRPLVAWSSVPGPTLSRVAGDGAVVERQITSAVNRAPEGAREGTAWCARRNAAVRDEGDVPGEGALVEVQGAGAVDAAAVTAGAVAAAQRVDVVVGDVVVDGGVGDRQGAGVVDAAAVAAAAAVGVGGSRVGVDDGVGDGQRAAVPDAAAVAAVGAAGVVVDGGVGDRQGAGVVDAAAVAAVASGLVAVDGGVGDRQGASVVDAAAVAAVGAAGVVLDGGVGDRQRASVVDAAAGIGRASRDRETDKFGRHPAVDLEHPDFVVAAHGEIVRP